VSQSICQFDHIAIGADSLARGVDWFAQLTNITLPAGGEHPQMGTHNHLTATGDDSFIEIIAINPAAPRPDRPRWFGLDNPSTIASLASAPRVLTWVVNTTNIDAALENAKRAGFDPGQTIELTRGNLSWRIAVRDDGELVENGVFPIIIEWPDGPHPAKRMTKQGVHIKQLKLQHPHPEKLQAGLVAIGADRLAMVEPLPGQELVAVDLDVDGLVGGLSL